MVRVVGIDAGYVNLAVCGINTEEPDKPYFWHNFCLFNGPFSEEKLVSAIYHWIHLPEIKHLLDSADCIVLERQMTMKFQAVNHCIRFAYFHKTKEVSPMSVGAFFGLPRERRPKKKAAVDLVSQFVVLPVKKGKKDDYADAFLLVMYELGGRGDFAHKYQRAAVSAPPKKKARPVVVDVDDF